MQAEINIKQESAGVIKKPGSFQLFRRLFLTGKKYLFWYVSLVAAALAVSATGLLDVEGLRRIINAATTRNTSALLNGVALCITALVLGQSIEFFKSYFGSVFNFISVRNLQSILITKINRVVFRKYDAFHTGDLTDRIKNSSTQAQEGLNNNLISILQNTVLIILIIVYLLTVNVKLTIAALLFTAILPVIISPLSKKLKLLYDESMQLNADKSAMIQDAVQGSEIVKTYMLSDYFKNSLAGLYTKIIGNVKKLIPYESFMFSSNIMIIVLGDFTILAFGGYLASIGELKVGDVIAFVLLFEQLFQPISYIASVWPQLQASLASAGRVFEILDLEEEDKVEEAHFTKSKSDGFDTGTPDIKEESRDLQASTPPLHLYSGDITFEDISFGYSDNEYILKNVNFSAEQGKVTAIVGPSGSGKSTVVKLLLKLYAPRRGRITYEGFDISQFDISDWRSRLSYVPQDNSLFTGTIRENIAYGNPVAGFDEIREAAGAANILEFVENRSNGFDEMIGENGINLSGGERQRISIARAVLSGRNILVLDEPTSALDNENEKKVMDALNKLMKNQTTIVIAHRLSTIINADRIIFLENGEVAETGTHNELMELKGRYYAMYNTMKESEQIC